MVIITYFYVWPDNSNLDCIKNLGRCCYMILDNYVTPRFLSPPLFSTILKSER